jgi:2-polyprenyl-3-methyl-5-hydroxy-6-metoxy-1,4-benzoquinol methylase
MSPVFEQNEGIRACRVGACNSCGSPGYVLYRGRRDILFAAPGNWELMACPRATCGLTWLSPRPLREEIGKLYLSYYTHHDAPPLPATLPRRIVNELRKAYLEEKYGYMGNRASEWRRLLAALLYLYPGGRAEADFSVMYLPASSRGRLLDVGCGSGLFLQRMRNLGWDVEGIDPDSSAVENARRKGLKVALGRLEKSRYSPESFDVITMSHVIEHVEDPHQLLEECHRVLNQSGLLILITPNVESWGHRLFGYSWRGLDVPRHLFIFTVSSLRHLTESAGFRKVKVATTIRGAAWMLFTSRRAKQVGRVAWGEPPSMGVRLWGEAMQLIEWGLLKLRRDIGEEILLIAQK